MRLVRHPASMRLSLLALSLAASLLGAQAPAIVTLPPESPPASVTQVIGLTTLSVAYHRPATNGRAIWGALVPYDSVWRAGANQNTVLTVSSPFSFGGTTLPAGRYALHMIPTTGAWTAILSRQANAWGSFSYERSEDAARTTVTPRVSEPTERLLYSFDAMSDSSATLTMRWEKVAVSIPIGVSVNRVVMDSLTQQYRGMPRFWPQAWVEGARWALSRNADLATAEAWADTSLQMSVTFSALRTKAAIQERRGNASGAAASRAQALTVGTQSELEALGFQTLRSGSTDDALAVFRKVVADHPRSWRGHEGMGDALRKSGDTRQARTSYQRALALAPDGQRARLTTVLDGLR